MLNLVWSGVLRFNVGPTKWDLYWLAMCNDVMPRAWARREEQRTPECVRGGQSTRREKEPARPDVNRKELWSITRALEGNQSTKYGGICVRRKDEPSLKAQCIWRPRCDKGSERGLGAIAQFN